MLWVLVSLVWGGSVLGQMPYRPVEEEYKVYTFEERAARVRVKKPGVVGGTVVTASPNYKWMCSLRVADDGCGSGISGDHICGGSIIDTTTDSKRWVLSAAHCFDEVGKSQAQTLIDNYNAANSGCDFRMTVDVSRDDPGSSSGVGQPLRMLGWQMHEDWDPASPTVAHDIALAYTYDSLSDVTPLVLKGSNCANCVSSYQMRLLGYGSGNPLERVILYFVSWTACDSAIDAFSTTWDLPVGTICTFKDTTHRFSGGDSGGPLIQKSSGKQVGIVSCYFSDTSVPQIYTDVTYYRDWIDAAKAKHENSYLVCHNNCAVLEVYFDDNGYCDCPECEDETAWTCTSCGGCSEDCGTGFWFEC